MWSDVPMTLRWIKTKNHKPSPRDSKWEENEWLLVDGEEDLARIYACHHGLQTAPWF